MCFPLLKLHVFFRKMSKWALLKSHVFFRKISTFRKKSAAMIFRLIMQFSDLIGFKTIFSTLEAFRVALQCFFGQGPAKFGQKQPKKGKFWGVFGPQLKNYKFHDKIVLVQYQMHQSTHQTSI